MLRLHPTQSQPYRSKSRFRVVVAGRRWGKTTLGKATQITWVQERGYRGARFGYIAPTYREGRRTFWDEFKAAIPRGWVAKVDEARLEITYRNGAQFFLLGADDPDSLRGPGWDGLHLDEYATMKPEAWTEVLRPALADRKGVALFTGTPQSFNHFHELFERGRSGAASWESWQFRTLDAAAPYGHIDPEEIEAARADLDERTFRQEFEASFEALSGRIYYAFDRQRNVGDVHLPQGVIARVSFDFNVEPATAVIGWTLDDQAYVWREVFLRHRGGEATAAAAMQVRGLLKDAGHLGPIRLYGDATGKSAKTTGPSDHAVIKAEFPGATWCVPNDQPHTKDRYAAVNSRCCTGTGLRRLTVDPSCRHLIADLEQVIFDDKGVEDQKSNPMLTHVSAALGYWLVADFPPVHKRVIQSARLEQFI